MDILIKILVILVAVFLLLFASVAMALGAQKMQKGEREKSIAMYFWAVLAIFISFIFCSWVFGICH